MMKPFLTSFLVVSIAGATAWQIGRARHPQPAIRPIKTTSTTSGAPSAITAPEATMARLFATRASGEAYRPLGAREFAALESVPVQTLSNWIVTRAPMPHDGLWTAATVEWATRDGPAALAFAMALRARHPRTGDCACCGGDPGGQYHLLVDEVFAAWLATDPAGALAHGVPPPANEADDSLPEKVPAMETLAFQDFRVCLDLAANETSFVRGNMASLVHMMDSDNRDVSLPRIIARQLAIPENQAAFTSWLQSRPDRHAALGIFARVWEGADHAPGWLHPDQIPVWMPLREEMPAEFTDPGMVRFMGALAVGAHPVEMTAANGREADELCAHAWAYRDPESATAWAASQPQSPERDFALVGLAKGLGHTDPAAATAWAATIQRNGTRLRETIRHFANWRRDAPEAALAWLESSPLSADERLAVRSDIPTSPWD